MPFQENRRGDFQASHSLHVLIPMQHSMPSAYYVGLLALFISENREIKTELHLNLVLKYLKRNGKKVVKTDPTQVNKGCIFMF